MVIVILSDSHTSSETQGQIKGARESLDFPSSPLSAPGSPRMILTRKMNRYKWKSIEVYTAFLFVGHTFWKESIEERVKSLELLS